jgi:hypothetical protein
MTVFLGRTVMHNVNGVGSDGSTVDLTFNGATTAGDVWAAVQLFWNHVYTTGHALSSFISTEMSRAANDALVEVYDITGHLDGSPHGSPVVIAPFTLGAATGTKLPPQLCGVLSFHAPYGVVLEHGPASATIPTDEAAQDEGAPAVHSGKTRPRSSLRGRAYIGPCDSSALASTGKLDGFFETAMKDSAEALVAAALGWSVWSRATATTHPVIQGWTQADFGTQRRRKHKLPVLTPWP